MALKDLICEEISCEHLVHDQWIDFRRSAYRFPDGREESIKKTCMPRVRSP
jgi:hypothetical protein